MNQISIRAVNQDNDKELREVAKLFRNVYSKSQLPAETFQVDFWKHHVGASFLSLAAFSGDTLVGHLGISRSRAITGCMELILPAFDVATLHDMYLIAESGYDQIIRLAERQGWNSIACTPFTESVEYLPILTDVLGLSETALLPSTSDEDQHTCSSLWFKNIKTCSENTRSVYLDGQFEPVLESLITAIGISDRSLITQTDEKSRPNLILGSKQRLCATDVYVDCIDTLAELPNGRSIELNKPGFFAVDASTPGAIATSRALAEKGFNLCGFIPNYYGVDRILFMNFELPKTFPEERFSKTGKILSFYMRSVQQHPSKQNKSNPYQQEFSVPTPCDTLNEENTIV